MLIASAEGQNVLTSKHGTKVITTNTVGAMGRGIALSFKKLHYDAYRKYRQLCKEGRYTEHSLVTINRKGNSYLLFPTKRHFKDKSDVQLIRDNLFKLSRIYMELGIDELHMPMLGCGNGWLNDKEQGQVMQAITDFADSVDIDVYLYKYS